MKTYVETFLHFVALYAPLFLDHKAAMAEYPSYGQSRERSLVSRRPPVPKTGLSAVMAARDYLDRCGGEALAMDPEPAARLYLASYFDVTLPAPEPAAEM
jgi:hypothetical protein